MLAVVTLPARNVMENDHSIPYPEVFHPFADCCDFT
jgi:hypothetical protein